jgi:DNA-3-methyladenine glycosylase I
MKRCDWVKADALYEKYHDEEWGVPVTDDQKLFEFLVLESAQAGLSWLTILRRRENYRKAFAQFDAETVSRFDQRKADNLMLDAGIIRNRAKIEATINNARAFLRIQDEFGSFARYSWCFVDGDVLQNKRKSIKEVPAITPEAEAFSKDLKHRGFKFLGPTVIYAHMQAVGMVNDHTTDCFRFPDLAKTPRHILFG